MRWIWTLTKFSKDGYKFAELVYINSQGKGSVPTDSQIGLLTWKTPEVQVWIPQPRLSLAHLQILLQQSVYTGSADGRFGHDQQPSGQNWPLNRGEAPAEQSGTTAASQSNTDHNKRLEIHSPPLWADCSYEVILFIFYRIVISFNSFNAYGLSAFYDVVRGWLFTLFLLDRLGRHLHRIAVAV